MRHAILLLAILTPSARACFDTTRGGCFTAGFVDNLSSAEDCQAASPGIGIATPERAEPETAIGRP